MCYRTIKHEGLLQELRDALSVESFQRQEQCTVKETKDNILQIEEIKREQQGCADRAIKHEGLLQELRDALSAESFQRQEQYKVQTKLLFEIINNEATKRQAQFDTHVDVVKGLLRAEPSGRTNMLEASATSIGYPVRTATCERKQQFKAHSKPTADPIRDETTDRKEQFQHLIENVKEAAGVEPSQLKTVNEHSQSKLDETRNMARVSLHGERKESREGVLTRKPEHLAASKANSGLAVAKPIAQHELTCANFPESPPKDMGMPLTGMRLVSPPMKPQSISASISTQSTSSGGHGRQWIHELLSSKIPSTSPNLITRPSSSVGIPVTCSHQHVHAGQTEAPIRNKAVLALA